MKRTLTIGAAVLALLAGLTVPAAGQAADSATVRSGPTVTVSPAAGLVDQQPVVVTGRHWGYAEEVELLECTVASGRCSAPLDVVSLDLWTFSHTFHVRSGFTAADGGWVDCRVESCLLRAQEPGVGAPAAETPLSFDPAGPPATPPSVSASPDTDLVDGQVITVSGTGLRPNEPRLRVLVCAQADPRDCTTGASVATDGLGAFSLAFTVYATRYAYDPVDCRSEPCLIRVAEEYRDGGPSVPISFRVDGPLVYDPTISADVDTGLVDGQLLTLSGSGWEPGRRVTITECNADRTLCPGYEVEVDTDATGSFTTEFRVRAQGDVRRRGQLDCRTEECSLSFDSLRSRVVVPLHFDAGIPPLPPPTVEVTPNRDLLPGQEVRVEGSGFFPHQELVWGQCDRSDYLEPPYCYDGDLTADANGRVSFTTRVSVSVLHYHGASDCRPDGCYIGISTFYEWYPLASAQLHQRPEGDEHVAVHPTAGLHDGDTVAVDATGLNVGFDVEVSQCVFPDPDDPDASACAPDSTTIPVAADGTVHATIRVQEHLRVEGAGSGVRVDCRVVRCWVVMSGAGVTFVPYGMYSNPYRWQGAAISFAGASAPAPPTAATPTFAG